MKFVRYRAEHKQDCLNVFKSNMGRFFNANELENYESYLNRHARSLPYFVVIQNDEVVACGGYAVARGMATLSWGMVALQHHGKAIGNLLLLFRLKALQKDYGDIPLTIDTSQKTRSFFEKYGFEPTAIETNGYGGGLDKIIMEYRGGTLL